MRVPSSLGRKLKRIDFRATDLIKSEPLCLVVPGELPDEIIQLSGCIPEAGDVFAEDNNDVRAKLLRLIYGLQLMQALEKKLQHPNACLASKAGLRIPVDEPRSCM